MFWMLPPDLQQRLEDIQRTTKRLQIELGITPLTLEQRVELANQRQQEKQRRQAELEKINRQLGPRRPPPKWKV